MSMTYAERRAAVAERREDRRMALEGAATAHYLAARKAVEHIPFGQPILIGHHSEGRHRRDLEKQGREMRRSIEASEAAARVANPTTAILSSDADALQMLAAEIAQAEATQTKMLAANKLIRKGDRAGLAALGFSEAVIAELFRPGQSAGMGFPSFRLTNNGANIRRMKERLSYLRSVKALPATERVVHGVRIEEDPEAVRLRLHFNGKPAPAIIAALKSNGFRWAPSEGAWQRQLSNGARYAAKQVLAMLAPIGEG